MSTCRRRFVSALPVLCLLLTLPTAVLHSLAAPSAAHSDQADGVAPQPQPEHSYVGRQGNAFVYEKASVDGADTEAPVLVWYVGVSKGNEPVVRYRDGPATGTLSCYDDCQFVTGITQTGGRITQTGRIRVTNDPLINAIMRDARSGALSQP